LFSKVRDNEKNTGIKAGLIKKQLLKLL